MKLNSKDIVVFDYRGERRSIVGHGGCGGDDGRLKRMRVVDEGFRCDAMQQA